MKFLFVHQNMPGQYREMLQWLVNHDEHEIVFLTQRDAAPMMAGVTVVSYKPHTKAASNAYALSKVWEDAAGFGYGAVMAAEKYQKKTGFKPDVILGHTGWGELLFFKQLWPDVPVLGFFEYYYNRTGGLVGFDPSDPPSEASRYILQARNTVPLTSIEGVDLGVVPTAWQRNTFPESVRSRLYTCHDGIRTDLLRPDPNVKLGLGRLKQPLTRDDEVFTYLARNLEHARGFHIFMRALPRILQERPNSRVIILGGNEVSYGRKSSNPDGLRAEMEAEIGDRVDWSRVHFLGRVPYSKFVSIVQLSKCHIYLTMPFVLSWSLLEAMSMEATVVSSDVAPVREAIKHGKTGLLVDFFDVDALADQVIDVLANPAKYASIGPEARAHVVEKYDFLTRCLPEHIRQINSLVPDSLSLSAPP